jgi:hypothetical protein
MRPIYLDLDLDMKSIISKLGNDVVITVYAGV